MGGPSVLTSGPGVVLGAPREFTNIVSLARGFPVVDRFPAVCSPGGVPQRSGVFTTAPGVLHAPPDVLPGAPSALPRKPGLLPGPLVSDLSISIGGIFGFRRGRFTRRAVCYIRAPGFVKFYICFGDFLGLRADVFPAPPLVF